MILACTFPYLTHEERLKSKIGQIKIKERKMYYNLIYKTLKYDMIPRMPDYLKIGSGNTHIALCECDSDSKLLATAPSLSVSGSVPF